MGISRQLAEFIARTGYEDIPAAVIENQKKSILDAIGVIYGASTLGDGCREMVALAEDFAAGGRPEATVLGFDKKLPAVWAAFANASMAHSLDFGDTHDGSTTHPNSASFPAALAAAERKGGVSGKELLTALVLGSETTIRVSLAADAHDSYDGFYPPTIYSSYGATAAVAKLLGLSTDGIVDALSFNLCQSTCSSELQNNPDTALRSVREAFAARNALTACAMAKAGLRGFAEPLEGKLGFYHAFLRDRFTPARALEGLGEKWEAGELTYKVWPCCFGNHAPITGALQLRQEYGIKPEEVRRIHVEVGSPNLMLLEPAEEKLRPGNAINAKFSIPFNVACALIRGSVTVDSYGEDSLRDPAILALAAKVDYTYHEDWEGRSAQALLRIETDRGVFEKYITAPFGTPQNPMSEADFLAKFFSCGAKAAAPRSRERLEAIRDAVEHLDAMADVSGLAALL